MTDEQIIKAWEKILSAGDAPIGKHWLCGSVTTEFAKATLDMLNRQNAEIERLISAVDNSTKEFLKLHDAYQDQKAEIERLERLLDEKCDRCIESGVEIINAYHIEVRKRCTESGIYPVIVKKIMEDVRKEMVGE
jgi:hypothetical protein